MKDGRVVANRTASEFTTRTLVEAMGSVVKDQDRQKTARVRSSEKVLSMAQRRGSEIAFEAYRGEIIGLAGLGGHGQTEALLDLYLAKNSSWLPNRKADLAFVAGDRSLNGTFSLWSILKNLSVASLRDISSGGLVDRSRESELGAEWKKRIEIRTPDMGNKILSLSGGNQQKVLFARALATTASTVLMDDPMRGVDIGTKQEVYDILRTEAAHGRTFIWYSTEMDEIRLCDRVYVFRDGPYRQNSSAKISPNRMCWLHPFPGRRSHESFSQHPSPCHSRRIARLPANCGLLHAAAGHELYGMNLLFNLAVPIALATIAQMLIMSVNDLDLSMGTFVSFCACVTATFLQDSPVIGIGIFAAAIAVYAVLGAVIHLRALPSIVVTLGMSFVWGGLAVLILPSPGGQAPAFVRALMTAKPPFVPVAIIASIVIAVVAHYIVMRSSFGVLMRGVGGNLRSVERSGWSVVGIRAATFALAGFFAVLSG